MIALEALYSDSTGDITYKLATRIPTLLNINRHYSFFLSKFVKKIYEVRSGIVHGSLDEKKIISLKINGLGFTSESAAEILESITRLSIKRFLNLLKDSPKKKDIIALLRRLRCKYNGILTCIAWNSQI